MQDHRHSVALFLLLAAAPAQAEKAAAVKIVPHEDRQRIEVLVDGKPFTEYRYTADVKKPVLFPLRTAEGAIITRGWPLEPRGEEPTDHPHHIGFWFNYGDVDGADFWGNSVSVKDGSKKGTIVHRKVRSARGDELVTESDWMMPDGKRALAEETTFKFGGGPGRRVVDRVAKLTATTAGAEVSMPDTKEGTLGLRLCSRLEHPSDKNPKGTGHYRSSEGVEGEAVWGNAGPLAHAHRHHRGRQAGHRGALRSPAQPRLPHLLARAHLGPLRRQSPRAEGAVEGEGDAELQDPRQGIGHVCLPAADPLAPGQA
jgi:hypothetical protein